MILSRFDRLDGAGHAYSLAPAGADVTRHFARNMHPTPGDTYPGQHAALAWEHVRSWFVPDVVAKVERSLAGLSDRTIDATALVAMLQRGAHVGAGRKGGA